MQPSGQPSTQPIAQPTVQPSSQPSRQPSMQPSRQPTGQPSLQPSVQPSPQPSAQPTTQPTEQPSAQPSSQPTQEPTTQPSSRPSGLPSSQPTTQPSGLPTNQPSSQPSIQPSCCPTTQPSEQPSVQPTARPTTQPSTKPSAQPSHQPTSLPSTQPSVLPSNQPSIQPSGQPSSQPTVQPSAMPTVMPTSQPSSQPLVSPTSQPSLQPSVQPSALPSIQPSSLPSAQPSAIPTDQPSFQPMAAPSTQPTTQPSTLPSVQPSSAPSTQPSTQPTSRPSAQPSEKPLSAPTLQPTINPGMWVTRTDDVQANHIVMIQNDVWACGTRLARTACITIEAQKGNILANYHLPWETMVEVLQSNALNRVLLSGRVVSEIGSVTSDVASCSINTALDCMVKSFYDVDATAVTYAPYLKKVLLLGKQNVYNSITIVDEATGSVVSYLYTSQLLRTFTFSHTVSPPYFVGTFVVGTAVSSSGFNVILAGMVRVDSGAMSCLALSPRSGSILNSAELVNAMALEYVNPDSFIAGGLALSDNAGICAYLLRVNSLIGVLKYGMRYRARSGFNTTRRLSSELIAYESVTRGVALVDTNIYMAVDLGGNNSTSLTVLQIDAETGSIIQQVHVTSFNASLSCSAMTASKDGLFLYFTCTIDRSGFVERVVISTDIALSFWKVPAAFVIMTNNLFTAEIVAFKTATVPISVRKAQNYIADIEFSTVENTLTPNPSSRPSSAPSGQPSSSPTAAPSVSSHPTSQPSTSGPTITYRPTVKPTQKPSTRPSRQPTRLPSIVPSIIPTVRPTTRPSTRPSPRPSVSPTTVPTRVPTQLPSHTPSRVVSVSPTVLIAESSTDGGKKKSSDEALVIGGSIFGGLLVLWCGKRMLKWIFHLQEQLEKKIALRELLMTSRSTIDPVQQRIVNETVQQRCAAVEASRQIKPATVVIAGPIVVSNNHSLDKVNVDAPPPESTYLWHQIDTDIENQPSTAPGLGRGAYINTWREETHTDAVLGDIAARKLSTVPSSGDFYDDASSEIELSSLHSSEQSDVSMYIKPQTQDSAQDQDQEQDQNQDQEQDQEETNGSLLPSSLESSGEESISEYSDSSDSTNSSSSAGYSSDDLSVESDNYSFPSSLTSGADNC